MMIRYLLILLLLCISGTALAAPSTAWRIDSSLQLDKRSLEARRKLDKIGQELILKNNRLEL